MTTQSTVKIEVYDESSRRDLFISGLKRYLEDEKGLQLFD